MGVIIKRALCFDLPTGGLIIGFLYVLFGLWNSISILTENETESKINLFTQLKPMLFIIGLLELISSLLLIRGTIKKSHTLILPWLIISGIILSIFILVTVLFLFIGICSISTDNGTKLLIRSIAGLLVECVFSYAFMIVYSLYRSIKEENLRPPQLDVEALHTNSNIQYNKT